MDPSTWMDPYSHLRVSSRNSQLNACSHPITSNRNLHHMTALTSNCQKNVTSTNSKISHKQQQQQPQQPMNQYATNPMDPTTAAAGQAFMNGHHYRPSNCSSWLFNSRQQHANHDNSLHLKSHPDTNTNMSSFNSSPFASLSHPHHAGVYDPNFMSAPFSQTSKTSNNYLSASMASDFVGQMKKSNDPQVNYRNNGSYCSTTKGFQMNMNDTCNNANSIPTGGFFSSHSLATNGWHHQNFMPPNVTANHTNNGVFHEQTTINNMMQPVPNGSTNNDSSSRVHNETSCIPSGCNKVQTNLTSKYHQNDSFQMNGNMNHNNVCQRYKNPTIASFSNMSALNSNNPYLMQNLSMSRNSQNSFVDPSLGAKFAAAAAHHDHYASFALAAAQAINTEYAAFQQSNPHKHSQYMPSMNNYAARNAAPSCHQSSEHHYPTVSSNHFKTTTNRHNFINYCQASLFPMGHPDVSMNAAFKSHNSFFEDYSSPLNPETINLGHATTQHQQQQSCKAQSSKTTRKSTSKINNSKSASVATINNSYNEFQTTIPTCPPSNNSMTNGNCCLVQQPNNNNNNNSNNNNNNNNNNNSVSNNVRCVSVASVHHSQPPQTNDSYSYNYPSPVTTNLSVHSPYQQRSSTSNSSHSSINSCALSQNGGPEYLNYGTPNSAPPTVFQTMGTSQTPTPTPGYPTPPSSVGHSNSRCNSNEELSPFSNNSMSSNMSHQSYGRNDFNKSSSSSSSQISPKVNDVNMTENLQFNSCMVAAAQQNTSSQQQQKNSSNLYSSNVTMDNSYKSPQYYSNPMNTNGTISSDSNDPTYANYASKDSSIGSSNQDSIKLQVTNVDDNSRLSLSASSYDYNYSESRENSFGHDYSEKTAELSSCSKETVERQRPSSHMITQLSENKSDYRPDLTSSNENVDDNFNLSFDSVIQPIEVNLPEQRQQQVQQINLGETNDAAIIQINGLNDQKSPFQSMDELNFIPSQNPNNKEDNNSYETQNNNHSTAQQSQLTQCDQYHQSSHETGPLMDEPNSIECSNMASLIDSLPKPCLTSEKNSENELLSNSTNNDNFLSDLAPLMNDNSKIALMESTFKSNQIDSVEHSSVVHGNAFDKIHKTIFDDIHKNDNQMVTYSKPDDEDNQFRDVDEFLKSNFKESPENENSMSEKNELSDNLSIVQSTNDILNTKSNDNIKELKIIENQKNFSSRKYTNKSNKTSNNKIVYGPNKISSSSKRKLNDVTIENTGTKKKRSKSSKTRNENDIQKIVKNVSEYEFKEDMENLIKSRKSKTINPSSNNKQNYKKSSQEMALSKVNPVVINKVVSKKEIQPKTTKSCKKIEIKDPSTKRNQRTTNNNKIKGDNNKKVKENSKSKMVSEMINSNSEIKENVNHENKVIVSKSKCVESSIVNNNNKSNEISLNCDKSYLIKCGQNISTKKSSNQKIKKDLSVKKMKNQCESSKNNNNDNNNNNSNNNHHKKLSNDQQQKQRSNNNNSNNNNNNSINSKPSLPLVTSSNTNSLLSPNLINASCLNKSVNPTLTNVTPTLIVNQSHSVNPYQVSPMTNAVLISIHPANPTPIPSLTAQSFITLNTQSVTSSTTSNTTTTTSGSSQNSSRRRSQDKKVTTIREGLMRTGDFVVAEEEAHLQLPVIWRIEGKSLLQRFEPSEQNGMTVYINTSSYSAWNPTVRQKYLGLDVRIMGCNRTRIVVEKIGLTQTKNDIRDTSSLNEKENNSLPSDSSPSNIIDHLENFEVLIQTLVSQALDSNFIAEIVKENDEYFLSHMQVIEDVCRKRKLRFITKIKWDNGILKSFETYPNIQIHKQNNVGDLRCRSCHDNWSTKILYFDGEPYNRDTFEKLSRETDSKKVKIAACDSCTEKIFLYSKLYHHKYNSFRCCKLKVDEIQSKDPNKESHVILEECLQDNDWMKKMFQELESILYSCDSLC